MSATPASGAAAYVPARAARLAQRAGLLRLLGSAFGYPTEARWLETRERLDRCVAYGALLPRELAARLDRFAEGIHDLDRSSFEAAYLRILTHVCAADCNPCETSYLSKHLFQVSQRLAAITGFYHAFGLSPAGERPDHIAVELEFLGFLCCREALEAADGASGSSLEMRAAQTTFLSNHLGKWAPAFALLVLRKAPAGPIRLLAELMDAAIRSEAKRLEVTLPDSPLDVGASLADRDFLHSSPMALAMGSFSEGVFRE